MLGTISRMNTTPRRSLWSHRSADSPHRSRDAEAREHPAVVCSENRKPTKTDVGFPSKKSSSVPEGTSGPGAGGVHGVIQNRKIAPLSCDEDSQISVMPSVAFFARRTIIEDDARVSPSVDCSGVRGHPPAAAPGRRSRPVPSAAPQAQGPWKAGTEARGRTPLLISPMGVPTSAAPARGIQDLRQHRGDAMERRAQPDKHVDVRSCRGLWKCSTSAWIAIRRTIRKRSACPWACRATCSIRIRSRCPDAKQGDLPIRGRQLSVARHSHRPY